MVNTIVAFVRIDIFRVFSWSKDMVIPEARIKFYIVLFQRFSLLILSARYHCFSQLSRLGIFFNFTRSNCKWLEKDSIRLTKYLMKCEQTRISVEIARILSELNRDLVWLVRFLSTRTEFWPVQISPNLWSIRQNSSSVCKIVRRKCKDTLHTPWRNLASTRIEAFKETQQIRNKKQGNKISSLYGLALVSRHSRN